MSHVRTAVVLPISLLLVTLLTSLATAVPAAAGPAPIEGEQAAGGGSATLQTSTDMSAWLAAGLGAAAALVLVLLAVAAVALVRHSHHAPHAA